MYHEPNGASTNSAPSCRLHNNGPDRCPIAPQRRLRHHMTLSFTNLWTMSTHTPHSLNALRERLTMTRGALRKSHVGLNDEIDRMMEAVAAWQLFHAAQERPRILGLWGMTGTGKSSIVRTLLQELELEERTCWLDAGECRRGQWLEQHMDLLRTHLHGSPLVVVIDEFQHARTVKSGIELEEAPELRRMWELIDAGRALLMPGYRRLEDLMDLRDQLATQLANGVLVRNGRVVRGITAFRKSMEVHMDNRDKTLAWAIPMSNWSWLRESKAGTRSLATLQRQMEQLDGDGLLALLDQAISEARTPHVFDARQALVIVLGNLDDLYVLGREPLPALDPDVLLARHERLSTTGVQQALLELFRIEQVARMGTDHLVLPPMGRNTVRELVSRETQRMAERTGQLAGAHIRISEGLLDRLLAQAAIPILGARPIVEAVQQVVPVLLSQVLLHPWSTQPKAITLESDGGRVHALVETESGADHMVLRWPASRPPEKKAGREIQLRVAVHEAGHLICGTRLRGSTPLQACSNAGHASIAGFVIWLQEDEPLTKQSIVPRLAVLLGGHIAEELVYGKEGLSAGSDDDLYKASAMALDLIRTHGLGNDLRYQTIHLEAPTHGFRFGMQDIEDQAQRWLEEAIALARTTLQAERDLLDTLARQMADAGSLGREDLKALLQLGSRGEMANLGLTAKGTVVG